MKAFVLGWFLGAIVFQVILMNINKLPGDTKPAEPIVPQFELGNCITLVQQPKRWEKPNPIYRIVKTDDEAYAVCQFEAGCTEYLQAFGYLETVYFKDQARYYQKGCNE